MKLSAVVIALCIAQSLAAPTTTTAPADEPIANGTVRFTPPQGWKFISKSENGLSAVYQTSDDKAMLTIAVTPQVAKVTDAPKERMSRTIIKAISDRYKKDGVEVLLAPTAERDERVYLRIHDCARSAGKVADRVQFFKVAGLNMVLVSVVAFDEDETATKAIHEIGFAVLDSAHPAKPTAVTIFGKSRFMLTPPDKWKEVKSDLVNGLAATYRNPADASQQIIVKSRIIPKDARSNDQRINAMIDQMIDADRNATLVPGAKRIGEPATSQDSKYLRVLSAAYEGNDGKPQAVSRYWIVGDLLIGMTTIGSADNAEQLAKITDELAASAKPLAK